MNTRTTEDIHHRTSVGSQPSWFRKCGLWLEWLAIFCLYPLIAYFDWIRSSKFLIFALPVVYALLIHLKTGKSPPRERKPVNLGFLLLRMMVISTAILWLARSLQPESFLHLPLDRPELWGLIVLLYPFISALPQEFLYRRFYVARYGEILPSGWAGIFLNGAVFAFLHIIYDNVPALILSFVGGVLFAWSYERHRVLWIPWLEHTVYGLAIFTFGIGHWFYEPIPA